MQRIEASASLDRQRGFTILEVMVAIVITAIAVFGVIGAVLAATHATSDRVLKSSLDDDALAVLSDVRMLTAYQDASAPATLSALIGKTATMKRSLASGAQETITVSIAASAPVVMAGGSALPSATITPIATATASVGTMSATESLVLYQHAPAPGSVVNQ